MSLWNRLFPRKPKTAAPRVTQPAQRTPPSAGGSAEKSERTQRREQLYLAVRDAMVRSGVLSSAYKFKVLSLDPQGRQFLVMIDIASANGGDIARQHEMAALLAQFARTRFRIEVTGVYWRVQPALGAAGQAASAPRADSVAPQPLRPGGVAVAVAPPVHPAPTAPAAPGFEPIAPDEVEAFKQAVQKAPAAAEAPTVALPRRQASARAEPEPEPDLESEANGFADTVLSDEEGRVSRIGGTQYGHMG